MKSLFHNRYLGTYLARLVSSMGGVGAIQQSDSKLSLLGVRVSEVADASDAELRASIAAIDDTPTSSADTPEESSTEGPQIRSHSTQKQSAHSPQPQAEKPGERERAEQSEPEEQMDEETEIAIALGVAAVNSNGRWFSKAELKAEVRDSLRANRESVAGATLVQTQQSAQSSESDPIDAETEMAIALGVAKVNSRGQWYSKADIRSQVLQPIPGSLSEFSPNSR